MRRILIPAVIISLYMLFGTSNILGHEDLTHQALSRRAVLMARSNAQDVPATIMDLFVDSEGNIQTLGQAIINGAGRHFQFELTRFQHLPFIPRRSNIPLRDTSLELMGLSCSVVSTGMGNRDFLRLAKSST